MDGYGGSDYFGSRNKVEVVKKVEVVLGGRLGRLGAVAYCLVARFIQCGGDIAYTQHPIDKTI